MFLTISVLQRTAKLEFIADVIVKMLVLLAHVTTC